LCSCSVCDFWSLRCCVEKEEGGEEKPTKCKDEEGSTLLLMFEGEKGRERGMKRKGKEGTNEE
jgi:hypothetical protein